MVHQTPPPYRARLRRTQAMQRQPETAMLQRTRSSHLTRRRPLTHSTAAQILEQCLCRCNRTSFSRLMGTRIRALLLTMCHPRRRPLHHHFMARALSRAGQLRTAARGTCSLLRLPKAHLVLVKWARGRTEGQTEWICGRGKTST